MFISFLFAMYQVVQEDTRSLGGWGGQSELQTNS